MTSLSVPKRSISLLMIIKSSQSESIEINFMQIFTRERRNSERRFFNHIITTTITMAEANISDLIK